MNTEIITKLNELIKKIQSDGNTQRLRAYKKALTALKSHDEEILSGKDAIKIKYIGKSVAEKIDEILNTGSLKELDENKDKVKQLQILQKVHGIGDVTGMKYINMGITDLEKLKEAHENNTITLTHEMLISLKYLDDLEKRIPKNQIEKLESKLKDISNKINNNLQITICGSYRRNRPDSGDIDVLITHPKPGKTNFLTVLVEKLQEENIIIDSLTPNGNVKFMGICKTDDNIARRIDILFVKITEYPAAILYFTGSGGFNRQMRTIANQKDLTINEKGIFEFKNNKKGKKIKANNEKEIFDLIGMDYLEPYEREFGK